MQIKVQSYSEQSSLISAIIFFIIGGILFWYQDEVIATLSMIVGIVLAVAGVIEIVIYVINKKKQVDHLADIIRGVIFLGLAVLFIFGKDIIKEVVRFVVGAWIMFSGINRFIQALAINKRSKKFWPLLIVSLILIAIGVYSIVYGSIWISTIGILMMIYAALDIVGYIFYTKDEVKQETEGTTALIVPDEEPKERKLFKKKNKKVKDVKEADIEEKEKDDE
jgi:uncharacterized membrane protein HdeD (DUF308 family)